MLILLVGVLQLASSVDCDAKSGFVESSETYKFILDPVPYAYDFLEPFLTSTIIYAHHDHHQQTYLDKLNTYLEDNPDLQENTLVELNLMAQDDTTLQKHAGGLYNHNMYWYMMTSPSCAKTAPAGPLLDQIIAQWGTFDAFIDKYKQLMSNLFGSGWVWACVNTSGDIELRMTENQINPLMQFEGSSLCYPFLGNDLWEHAYYLKYMWDRTSFLDSYLTAIDWDVVEVFYELYASQQEAVPL